MLPGTLGRLGLGYEELRQVNPALVVTSISNFGQTGPYRDWKAAEVNLYAMGGLMNITGEPDREPLKEGAPLAQLGAGQNAFVATMAALMYAEETGEGQQIDISIAEYATNILENALMQYSYSGQEYTRVGNRGLRTGCLGHLPLPGRIRRDHRRGQTTDGRKWRASWSVMSWPTRDSPPGAAGRTMPTKWMP